MSVFRHIGHMSLQIFLVFRGSFDRLNRIAEQFSDFVRSQFVTHQIGAPRIDCHVIWNRRGWRIFRASGIGI